MKVTTPLSAALGAATLSGLTASAASASPAADRDDDVRRAIPSQNGKDVFVRIVKVPRVQATAEKRDFPMMGPAHRSQPKAARPQAKG